EHGRAQAIPDLERELKPSLIPAPDAARAPLGDDAVQARDRRAGQAPERVAVEVDDVRVDHEPVAVLAERVGGVELGRGVAAERPRRRLRHEVRPSAARGWPDGRLRWWLGAAASDTSVGVWKSIRTTVAACSSACAARARRCLLAASIFSMRSTRLSSSRASACQPLLSTMTGLRVMCASSALKPPSAT